MKLTYQFTVGTQVDATWRAVTAVESVSGCLPGASVTAPDGGDDLEGQFKIKFGQMYLVYQGTGRITSRDAQEHALSVEARGRDIRGSGTAAAVVSTRLREADGGTTVEISVDPTLTGRPAQLGPGVITEAVDWQIDQYAACLSRKLTESPELVSPVQRSSTSESPSRASRRAAAGAPPTADAAGSIPRAVSRARNVTPALVRQYGIPVLGGLAALFAVFALIKRRRT